MNTLLKRSITGLLFVVVLLTTIILSQYSFAILFMTIMVLSLVEFYKLLLNKNVSFFLYPAIIFSLLLFLLTFLHLDAGLFETKQVVFVLIYIPFIIFLSLFNKKENKFQSIAINVFGILYITLPFILLNFFVFIDEKIYNPEILLGYFFITWIFDTGAYLTGTRIGKTPLSAKISPKKTWEGTIGGLIFSIAISYLMATFFYDLSKIQWIILSLITVTGSILGDLSESMLKRWAGVKDSGTVLPGHGGILDRFDSVLISSPLVFIYLYLV